MRSPSPHAEEKEAKIWRGGGRGGCSTLPHSQVSRHRLGLPTQLHVTHNHVSSPQGHQLHTHAFLLGHRGLWEWGQGSERGEQGREGSTQRCSP